LAPHPVGGMRAVGCFFGSGIMDRFPNMKFGILESGFGWLPFWARRMDDQVVYMGYVNEHLEYRMSEYLTGGRFFASVVLHEGEDMVKMVSDDLGDHIRSEEHTSELQSRENLVCRLLLEKKKIQ